MDRKRSNNDAFRPALRFPTDPHNPTVLPSKIQHIVGSSPGSSASNLLQSKRKPWEVDVTRIDDLVAQSSKTPKVVVVLGDPSAAALEPIVTSGYLKGSLVIIVASAESDLSLSPSACVPYIRILRLRPSSTGSAPQHGSRHGAPSSHGHHPSQAPELPSSLSASRLNTVLDWAERVAGEWRQATPNTQIPFAVLREENVSPQPDNQKPWKWKNRSKSHLTSPTGAEDQRDADGRLMPWTARFALNSRSNASSLADSSSTSSVFIPDAQRQTFSNSSLHNQGERSMYASIGRSQTKSAPPSTVNRPDGKKRRFSIVSFNRQKSSTDLSVIPSKSSQWTKPVFDAVINFLPPPAPTADARGAAVASTHALAAHGRLLLRQTILVTTATQRFLVPVPPRSSGSTRTGSDPSGRFGSMGSGGRPLTPRVGTPNQKAKRWSLAFMGSFFGGEPPVSAKAAGKRTALPTPPMSRPSSSDEPAPPSAYRRPSVGVSRPSMTSSHSRSWTLPPKLIHILPFPSSATSSTNARLIRSVEAFLLSWSFGGGRDGADIPEEGASEGSSQSKRTIRPFLLDVSGMAEILRANDPFDHMVSREWSLTDLILSGAMDDEYPCSGPVASPASGLSTPEVILTRPSSDQRPTTAPSRYGETSRSSSFSEAAAFAEMDPNASGEAWAARRAWLGSIADLIVYPSSARLPGMNDERTRTKSLQAPTIRQPMPPGPAMVPAVPNTAHVRAHARSQSESSTHQKPVPPPRQPPFPPVAAPSAFPNRLTKALPRQPSYSDDGHSYTSSPRKLTKSPSLKRSTPELGRKPSHGDVRPNYSTPIANAFSSPSASSSSSNAGTPRAFNSPFVGWQPPPAHRPSPMPVAYATVEENDSQFGVNRSPAPQWTPRPSPPHRQDTLTTINTMQSYSTNGSFGDPYGTPYGSVRGSPAPLPTPMSSGYHGISIPHPLPRPPQLHPEQQFQPPPGRPLPPPEPVRRPSEGEGYFNGYLIAPQGPPPPRPDRMRPPPVPVVPDARNNLRGVSSPLRHGVSAPAMETRLNGGSVRNKQLPITPPDSASSSEVSNEGSGSGSGRSSDKKKWWAGPSKVTVKSIRA